MSNEHWEDEGDYPEGKIGKAEKCKPDYEKIISELKTRHHAASTLYEAIKLFIRNGDGVNKYRLKDLLGHLDCQVDTLNTNIEILLSEQEADK